MNNLYIFILHTLINTYASNNNNNDDEGKRPLGRPRRRWADNIKMDLQEVERGCGDWIKLAQDMGRWQALVSTVMNFRVVS